MSVINTNVTSLIAQKNLGASQSSLTTAMERLSSGMRINSAKDDAAGQAIANRMSSQITGLSQAQRNANDGISVAQTAEGALNQINDNLQRVRELTVQAQNGTNSAEDKASIQAEIKQRMTEIDRISEQTDFNGTKVLSKDQSLSIQVGANDGEVISIGLKEITSKTLGLDSFNVSGPKGTLSAANATAYKAAYGDTTQVTANTVAEATANGLATNLGVATGSVTVGTTAQVDESGNWYTTVTINTTNAAELSTLNAKGLSVESGVTATFYIALDPQAADTSTTAGTAAFTVATDTLSAADLQKGSSANPLAMLDAALSEVDTLRSDLGAIQNRFDSAISNLKTNETNLSAARSRIEDADYAVEVANMTKAQILQQAGTSVLAQANQVPQGVLSLLG